MSEAESGVTAVAAPIRANDKGPVLGTVSIAGPSARINERRVAELGPMVLKAAHELGALWPLRVGIAIRQDVFDAVGASPQAAAV